jgi:diguanylate cyclase (GGDEF)-like protein/PAS domain S-box-containing protein
MKRERNLSWAAKRRLLPRFFRVFLPLVLFFLTAIVIYFVVDTRHEEKLIRAEQAQQVALSRQSLQRDISGVIRELGYLAAGDNLKRFISSGDERARAASEEELARFASHIGRYDQLRWLDRDGRERLRVDHRDGITRIVPSPQLQDKSKRYYFIEAMKLPPGETYISPLDLNVEHGKIELPYRPMLRFATLTADEQGRRNGLLIINYQASLMLNSFMQSLHHDRGELSLLNGEGYWLASSAGDPEWGFMFRRDERFQHRHPQVWATIRQQGSGSIMTRSGLFTFSAIDVATAAGTGMRTTFPQTPGAGPSNASWVVVSFYPRRSLASVDLQHLILYGMLSTLVLLMVVVISWKMARAVEERKRLVDRLALHAKVMETASNGVMITDNRPRVVVVNQAFTELTGYSREEIVGKDPSILASGRHAENFFSTMWQALEEKGHWEGEIWNRHKSGELYPEWLTISAVPSSGEEALYYIAIFSMLSEQKSTEARLRQLANSDPLTGLLNRNLLYDHAGQALAQSRRAGNRTAFLFLDLDGFKLINDAMGHAAGDMVLKGVAKRLKGCVRESDTVARFGGDEFVVLLGGLETQGEAAAVAEKIISAIKQPFHIAGEECQVGVSIGISLYPDDGDTVEALIKRADEAMYQVKESGRGQSRFYRHG